MMSRKSGWLPRRVCIPNHTPAAAAVGVTTLAQEEDTLAPTDEDGQEARLTRSKTRMRCRVCGV